MLETLIEFENKAGETIAPVQGWYDAICDLQKLSWNPEDKNEVDLIMGQGFGIHALLDLSGFGLTLSVYQIFERAKRPDAVKMTVTEDDGSVTSMDGYEFEFDPKYFVSEQAKVAGHTFNLKSIFGRDWEEYLQYLEGSQPGRDVYKIEQMDWARAQKHKELSDKLLQKLARFGLKGSHSNEYFKGFINMLVDYHYQYGRTQNVLKKSIPAPGTAQPS